MSNVVNGEPPIYMLVTHSIFSERGLVAARAHTNCIHIILIDVRGARLLEAAQYSGALGTTCSIQMPWLQMKA